MKKKIIAATLIICFLLSGCQHKKAPEASPGEIRGVWISCYDWESAAGKTAEEYSAAADKMFENIRNAGLNTAFVHLRAFSDAFYKSDIFPYSKYIAATEGASLPFDPFEIMLASAGKYGISVHGWINPYRVSTKPDISSLSKTNPARILYESGSDAVKIISSGIYYNPASAEALRIIISGIREIAEKYDIDGIHIDDYFYPADFGEADSEQYEEYISAGGRLEKADWRRAWVDSFISGMYNAVKSVDDNLAVSISPAARAEVCYEDMFADCRKWLSTPGYADIIIPQLYFGFEETEYGFSELLEQWNGYERCESVRLLCGLAAYKCGKDESEEWSEKEILTGQTELIREEGWDGFVLFSYADLLRSSETPGIGYLIKNLKGTEAE